MPLRECNGDDAVAGICPGAHLLHREFLERQPDGNHAEVFAIGLYLYAVVGLVVVLIGAYRAIQVGQLHLEHLAALYGDGAPFQFLHRIFRFHPESTGGTPPRGTGNAHFEPQGVGQLERIAEGVFPFLRHIGQSDLCRPGHVDASGIKLMQASDVLALHPQEVFSDALLAHIAVHPVPPHIGAGLMRRVQESPHDVVGLLRMAAKRSASRQQECYII